LLKNQIFSFLRASEPMAVQRAVGGEKSVFTRNTNLIRTPKILVFFYWAYYVSVALVAQKSDIFVPKVIRISSVLFLGFYVSVALVAWKNGFFPYYRWLHAESCATEL